MFTIMVGPVSKEGSNEVWDLLEPFSQLFRAMMPRAATIAVFNSAGRMRWSSDATIGPDLSRRVDAMLPVARNPTSGEGALEMLGGQPAYLFWIRGDNRTLLAVVAVLTRAAPNDSEPRAFSFAHQLLRPALECLRRELLTMQTIDDLKAAMGELDEDLELLLADAADANTAADGADELKSLLQRMVGHLEVHGGGADCSGEGHRTGARRERLEGRWPADCPRPPAAAADRHRQHPSGHPQ